MIVATIALAIAGGALLTRTRSTSWEEPLWVAIYPILADDSQIAHEYVDRLEPKHFASIEKFLSAETARYGVDIDRPIRIDVGDTVASIPPAPPHGGNPLQAIWWSLKIQWWARSVTADQPGAPPDIRMFVIYHDPEIRSRVPHSLGLRKGMLGVVHAFAVQRMKGSNQVVIAHELLHTLGATDKYAPDSNLPLFPIGFAEPGASPLFPQRYAEIMGGRIPISESEAEIPRSLRSARVGPTTALEIRWIDELPDLTTVTIARDSAGTTASH
ncbi:MAG: hypothetical protein ACR2QV_01675 [Gammaproteobacteria bacterium]